MISSEPYRNMGRISAKREVPRYLASYGIIMKFGGEQMYLWDLNVLRNFHTLLRPRNGSIIYPKSRHRHELRIKPMFFVCGISINSSAERPVPEFLNFYVRIRPACWENLLQSSPLGLLFLACVRIDIDVKIFSSKSYHEERSNDSRKIYKLQK